MIHNVARWSVRMDSGEVHVIDPITVRRFEEVSAEERLLIEQAKPIFEDVSGGYALAYAYDRLDSKAAGTYVLIMLHHVASVRVMDVQIEAPEDVSFPIPRT